MRKEKREVTRSELQTNVAKLRTKNRELFRFMQIDRQNAAKAIRDAQEGMQEAMLAMNLILGEVIRKYGEVTIPMPDAERRQYYSVVRDKEKRTITFRPAEAPAGTAENGTNSAADTGENPGNARNS